MFVFIAIAAAGFILLLAVSVVGQDHDHDSNVDQEHDAEGADEPTVSIFSIKVLATFIMGFGAGGAIAAYYNAGPLAATGVGFGTGVILALLMYAVMRVIYIQQASSLVATESIKRNTGTWPVAIREDALAPTPLPHHQSLALSPPG